VNVQLRRLTSGLERKVGGWSVLASIGAPSDQSSSNGEARDVPGRLLLSVAVGLITAWFALKLSVRPNVHTDFEVMWTATRHWADGRDPYVMRPGSPAWKFEDPLFYPLPALILLWPLHWISRGEATACFVAIPAALLAWRLTRHALWPLLALASPSFAMAVVLGQWTPWLVLAMLWPALGFFLAGKPTLGLACFAGRPTAAGFTGGAAITIISFALWPAWPWLWLHNLSAVAEHPSPIAAPFGFLLGLAALRWRRPEARLLLAMACVPQLLLFADQLPLMLIARCRREAALLAIGAWTAAVVWFVQESDKFGAVSFAAPYVLAGCYLPALWIVLRQPNQGVIPEWLERRIVEWPSWLRGTP
jgi:uncharacterized protein (TIGR03382 family)